MTIRADTTALEGLLDQLGDDVEEAARPAAQAGAQVLYNAVKVNVARLGSVTGNLANSIYQAYSQSESSQGLATYHISWNHKKAPHGGLVENGHLQIFKAYVGKDGKWYTNMKAPLKEPRHIEAKPFVRPAQAMFPQALEAAEAELLKRIDEGKS